MITAKKVFDELNKKGSQEFFWFLIFEQKLKILGEAGRLKKVHVVIFGKIGVMLAVKLCIDCGF